jgi:hypothetical protein
LSFSRPPAPPQRHGIQLAFTVSNAAREAYHQTVQEMADFPLGDEHILSLAPDASAALRAWEAEIEAMLRDGGDMELMRDWGGKLAGETLRLAAVLHCVRNCENYESALGVIKKPTIEAAISIARYLIPHAEAVLRMMEAEGDSIVADAQYILAWIERHNRRKFTKRDAQQHGKKRFPKATDIDPALAELVERGYIRLRPPEPAHPGRPPSPSYEVNPLFFEKENSEKRSHNSQNSQDSDERPENGNCENNENALQQSENDSSENNESALGESKNTIHKQVTV